MVIGRLVMVLKNHDIVKACLACLSALGSMYGQTTAVQFEMAVGISVALRGEP